MIICQFRRKSHDFNLKVHFSAWHFCTLTLNTDFKGKKQWMCGKDSISLHIFFQLLNHFTSSLINCLGRLRCMILLCVRRHGFPLHNWKSKINKRMEIWDSKTCYVDYKLALFFRNAMSSPPPRDPGGQEAGPSKYAPIYGCHHHFNC